MAEIKQGPGRPKNSLPTAAHVLQCVARYEKEGVFDQNMTITDIKLKLSEIIVDDQLNKKANQRIYMKEYRSKKED